uniref:non-specific serine/threonine protein kinase n=1 Tax=Cacopsylla melanoneura TaxID=428564 RepID=A0A8D8RDU0_9HEMI
MSHIAKKFKLTESKEMDSSELLCFKQGAEGRLFKTNYLGKDVLVKERFSKKYRHPDLDKALTKERITSEIRGLMKCRTAGIRTPAVYAVNSARNQIVMELIDGKTVKDILLVLEQSIKQNNISMKDKDDDENEMSIDEDSGDEEEDLDSSEVNGKTKNKQSPAPCPAPAVPSTNENISLSEEDKTKAQAFLSNLLTNSEGTLPNSHKESNTSYSGKDSEKNQDTFQLSETELFNIIKILSLQIGQTLSTMHANNIIHGDLTTSNMLVDRQNCLVLIDFGLSLIKVSTEDKAVDLYVLKRAILSLHSIFRRDMFDWVLASYRRENRKQAEAVLKTFAEVEMRGRKRCMVG